MPSVKSPMLFFMVPAGYPASFTLMKKQNRSYPSPHCQLHKRRRGGEAEMAPTGRPRGRPRKVGHTRMHAAWDAMRSLGFTQYMVVKTAKELLQVYGEEGWKFIENEENSYKVLVDSILEKVEKREKKEENDMEHASSSNKSTVEIEKTPVIAFPAACCDDEDEPLIGELQVTETPDSAAQTPKQPGGSDMKQRRRHYYHGWTSTSSRKSGKASPGKCS